VAAPDEAATDPPESVKECAMLISVVNHTTRKDEEVQEGIRAVNRQIAHDFKPYWHIAAELRLEGTINKHINPKTVPELRGDAILYLWDKVDVDDALGYHELNGRGVPFGFVFTEVVEALDEPWTVTFSHEALDLIGDPETNRLVSGPHPANRAHRVFHWYEMCDAVQDDMYRVDGIEVSNFVLPLYFTRAAEKGGRNDFLGTLDDNDLTLESFGINKGGYIGFYDPVTRKHETFAMAGDVRAKKRLEAKAKASLTRRSMRYKTGLKFDGKVRAAARVPDDRRRAPRAARSSTIRTSPRAYQKIASYDERADH
jgi:hypothetical protein